ARLTLAGRHLSSSNLGAATPLGWGDLQMLSFPKARSLQRWLSVESAGGMVRLGHATGIRELSASDLTPAQRRLFDRPPQGLVVAIDSAAPQIEVVTEPSRAGAPAKPRVEPVALGSAQAA